MYCVVTKSEDAWAYSVMNFKQIGQKYTPCGQNFMYGFVLYDFSLHPSLNSSHFLIVTCRKLQYAFLLRSVKKYDKEEKLCASIRGVLLLTYDSRFLKGFL